MAGAGDDDEPRRAARGDALARSRGTSRRARPRRRHRHRQLAEAVPHRRHRRRCRGRAATRRGLGGVAQPVGVGGRATSGDWPANSGWAPHPRANASTPRARCRRRAPRRRSRRSARSCSSAIPAVVETSTSRVTQVGLGEREVQREPAAHRVAGEREGSAWRSASTRSSSASARPPRPGRGRARGSVRASSRATPSQLAAGRVKPWSRTRSAGRPRTMPATSSACAPSSTSSPAAACAQACTSPGSRSTPLVLSLAREPRIRAARTSTSAAAAFFALGLAKATGVPVALACTSGTAAANYAPAVIEAHEARRPAARPDRRPPAGAARARRRADDRPGQALRQRRQVVPRGRRPPGDAGAHALAAPARVPRVLDRDRGPPGRRAPQLPLARAARARRAAARRGAGRRRRAPATGRG